MNVSEATSMFIAEVLGVRADSRFIDKETGKFDLEKAGLIAYSHGAYHKLGLRPSASSVFRCKTEIARVPYA